jgi:hypothetical protein
MFLSLPLELWTNVLVMLHAPHDVAAVRGVCRIFQGLADQHCRPFVMHTTGFYKPLVNKYVAKIFQKLDDEMRGLKSWACQTRLTLNLEIHPDLHPWNNMNSFNTTNAAASLGLLFEQCTSLHLDLSLTITPALINVLSSTGAPSYNQLQDFTFYIDEETEITPLQITASKMPNLQYLSCSASLVTLDHTIACQLTSLYLFEVNSPGAMIAWMQQCKHLKDFVVNTMVWSEPLDNVEMDTAVFFPETSLSLHADGNNICCKVLMRMHAPNLDHIVVGTSQPIWEALRQCIKNSSCKP